MINVEIYGKQNCTYCTRAKDACEVNRITYTYYDVGDNPELIDEIEKRSGVKPKTVPQIFVDDEYIEGGYTGFKQYLISTKTR